MYREISHTADEAYEIIFSDENELFQDLVDIINKKVIGSVKRGIRREIYKLSGNITDDVFDVANDIIYMVDKGWIPMKARVNDEDESVVITYYRAKVEAFDFKALTYLMSLEEIEDKKIMKVVFDV